MFTLTDAQESQINSAQYTHDWEAEAFASYEATGDDLMNELKARFEREFTDYDFSKNLGGITVYFKGPELVAFYDQEQFRGSVFATQQA